MADIDPDTLLEWLTMGAGDERDMQMIALEQLCMLLLMSDNVDRCFESCPPRSFLPALCHIFMDETAPDNILEVTARAITYYLDVSAECSRRIVNESGAVKALCTRLVVVDISSRASRDLAEQCVKVLELMCTREAGAIYEAGGLNCMLTFIREYGSQIHKDTLHSAMSVVARLCSKMEPADETLEGCMDSLSKLLQHEDSYVADVALKCFACLADRFTRRGVDPAPLAKHGLTEELLKKLVSSALACNLNTSTNLNASMTESRSSSGNVSIIVSVLSMLCRGSPTVTHDLLRSSLPNAIETAMKGDERCVLDTMRLVDLLLVLLFEGRDALPKSTLTTTRGSLSNLRKTDSAGDKSHRQLIDCIRSKDTDALMEAIDSSTFDVNFMDDVGQTLLNWASAFGTLEMVEFLCQRGADVNRGQRSSSLHYAACFGRPAVAKVLLLNGANPELRDEDSKTPLDKARERNDEGHKEVVRILQSPGEWMAASSEPPPSEVPTVTENAKTKKSEGTEETRETGEDTGKTESEQDTDIVTVKGDPEMAPVYVKRLVPVFANTYQASLVPSIKKATLSILKKMIHYIPVSMMEDLVSGNVAPLLVDVIATALNAEGDDEGHLSAFHCVQDLMSKGPNIFLIHFIRLGVLQRITEMSNESEEVGQEDLIDGIVQKEESTIPLQDATKLLPGRPYHWHDWCIVRGRDCLYLWSDFCAIELSNGSNGWFRFVLDGKLATMYSSGSPEGGSSSSESRTEFLDKLQRARSAVPSSTVSQPILSSTKTESITVGNWTLSCKTDDQVVVINTDGQQATILKEDLPGFLFESNRGTKHTFTAETSLGPDFAFSWNGKPGKKFQSKKEQIRQKLSTWAHSLYCKYFKDADMTPHGAMATLHKISETLNTCASSNEPFLEEKKKEVYEALQELCTLLKEESMLSSYEIQTSGLVTALNNCLNKALPVSSSLSMMKEHSYAVEVFKNVFGQASKQVSSDESLHLYSPAVTLVRKLIMVLESTERLPVLTYEGLGGGSGLQILLRRLRFKLERGHKSGNFIDRTGRFIKMEPLTTVKEVEKYLLKAVAKQWFDYERDSFEFMKYFKENNEPLVFTYEQDFDENGIIYWLGTNGKTVKDWVNPARHNIVNVSASEGRSLPYGRLEDVISRDSAAVNCHTNDDKSAWFMIDLGVNVIPTAYTLRHSRGYGRSALRNWLFQMSKDGTTWSTLKTHENDESLQEPGSTSTWQLEMPEELKDGKDGWNMLRIQQNGPNASRQTYYLSVSGLEVYGKVTGVMKQVKAPAVVETESTLKRQRRVFRSQMLRHMALGAKEGSDWKLLREHARAKAMAEENKNNTGWVDVTWPQSSSAAKTNEENAFNVKVVDISDPAVQAAMLEAEKRGKNENNKALHQTTLDNALKQVVMSFGKRASDTTADNKTKEDQNKGDDPLSTENNSGGSEVDLANLRFLMAVEDLLDSSSSDLVANALAEAASMRVDQLRLATQSFRNTLLEPSQSRPTPSAQGSRESQSPPSELSVPVVAEAIVNETDETKTEESVTTTTDDTISDKKEEDTSTLDNESTLTLESTPAASDKDFDSMNMSKEECLTQIKKITSSMSEVLEAMTLTGPVSESNGNFPSGNLDDDFAEAQSENLFTVAENNFLNDNHNTLEPNVIAILNDENDNECSQSDDDDDDDDDDRGDTPHADREKAQTGSMLIEQGNESETENEITKLLAESKELDNILIDKDYKDNYDKNSTLKTDMSSPKEVSEEAVKSMLQLVAGDEDIKDIDRMTMQALQLLSGHKGQHSEKMSDLLNTIMADGQNEDSKDVDKNNTVLDKKTSLDDSKKAKSGDDNAEPGMNLEFHSHIKKEPATADPKQPSQNIDTSDATSEVSTSHNLESNPPGKDSEGADIDHPTTDQTTEPTGCSTDLTADSNVSSEIIPSKRTDTSESLISKSSGKEEAHCDSGESNKSNEEDKRMYTLEEILEVHRKKDGDNTLESKISIPKVDENVAKISEAMKADLEYSTKEKTSSEVMMDIDGGDNEDEDDDDDDEDDDDDFDDIENDDENEAEDMYEPMHTRHHERHYDHQRKMWDDDLVLKCQHAALVPAFDPRPGRTNVQQTQDIEIPTPDALQTIHSNSVSSNMMLYLRGSPSMGGKEVEVPLDNPHATVFSYVQSLVLHGATGPNKNDRLRRVWEPNFTIVYKSRKESGADDAVNTQQETDAIKWRIDYVKEHLGSLQLPKSDVINYLQQSCDAEFLKKWKLTGTTKLCRKQRNCSTLTAAYKEFAKQKLLEASKPESKEKVLQIEEPVQKSLEDISAMQQVLEVIKSLYQLAEDISETVSLSGEYLFDVPAEEFLSKKLTTKLAQQIQDPLSLTSGSLPLWCEYLVINYPTLFPFETRQMFFRATAFGCSRSIVCLQSMQDAALERTRGHPTRRLETQEFRIGRLKHERVTVPRGEELLETAIQLMDFHAERKAVLEIEFKDEEGTGLGPSLEFYALISMAIQRNDLNLWVSIDEITSDDSDGKSLMKYSRHPNGLFPAPFPSDNDNLDEICRLFSFLGIFLAKCLQDSRLVDIPLSEPFFKMLCAGKGKYAKLSRTLSHTSELTADTHCSDDESVDDVFDASMTASVEKLDSHYFSEVLTDCDFELIHPNKAKFLKQLKKYVEERQAVLCDDTLSDDQREKKLNELLFLTEHGHTCKLEDLGLTFQYVPSSNVFGFDFVELKPNGGEEMLAGENAEEYIQLLTDFTMHKGVARQLEAFRAGFNRVFPMEKLHAFKPREIQLMLCGEQVPKWTYDELLLYTEPKYGYHKDSPGFLRLLKVLVAMNGDERKAFLQFATGCSSLPPGGIANLHPRLTVVKKEDEGDGSFPSVNTCVHYLKLPEYSSEEVLREKLLAATKEKGFHLN